MLKLLATSNVMQQLTEIHFQIIIKFLYALNPKGMSESILTLACTEKLQLLISQGKKNTVNNSITVQSRKTYLCGALTVQAD